MFFGDLDESYVRWNFELSHMLTGPAMFFAFQAVLDAELVVVPYLSQTGPLRLIQNPNLSFDTPRGNNSTNISKIIKLTGWSGRRRRRTGRG